MSWLLHFDLVSLFLILASLIGFLGRITLNVLGTNEFPHYLDRRSWPAGLRSEDLAGLVDDKDASGSSFGSFLESNGADQARVRVTEQRVGQILFRLKGRVGLGRIGREAKDGESRRGQRLVGITEETCLRGAWINPSQSIHPNVNFSWDMSLRSRQLTTRCRSFGIGEEHHSSLARVDQLLQGRLLAVVGLDLSSKPIESNGIADCDLGRRRCAICRRFGLGLARLGGGRGLAVVRLLLGRWWWHGRRRRLALAKLDRHDGQMEL